MTREKCRCLTCPNYTACARKGSELVFCATGRSFVCITKDRGCLCPDCPVIPVHVRKNQTSCLRGFEPAQRYVNPVPGGITEEVILRAG